MAHNGFKIDPKLERRKRFFDLVLQYTSKLAYNESKKRIQKFILDEKVDEQKEKYFCSYLLRRIDPRYTAYVYDKYVIYMKKQYGGIRR